MPTVTFLLDELSGDLLLERPDHLPAEVVADLATVLGSGQELGCARPVALLAPPVADPAEIAAHPCVRIAGYYHHSLIEGPGRRSCALLSGCDLGCRGCWVPHLHAAAGGTLVPVDRLAAALLDPAYPRNGISLLGGEPFVQPVGLLALVRALRARGCPHILCYSGYTYEALRRRAVREAAIGAVLDEIDMLIDGPFVETLASSAGPWTGSGNQRVLTLRHGRPTPWREVGPGP